MLFFCLFSFPKLKKILLNKRGQGLIEYLVIVALMGVATIAVVRVMGETVENRFANVTNALQGKSAIRAATQVTPTDYKKKDLGDFFQGSSAKGAKQQTQAGE